MLFSSVTFTQKLEMSNPHDLQETIMDLKKEYEKNMLVVLPEENTAWCMRFDFNKIAFVSIGAFDTFNTELISNYQNFYFIDNGRCSVPGLAPAIEKACQYMINNLEFLGENSRIKAYKIENPEKVMFDIKNIRETVE